MDILHRRGEATVAEIMGDLPDPPDLLGRALRAADPRREGADPLQGRRPALRVLSRARRPRRRARTCSRTSCRPTSPDRPSRRSRRSSGCPTSTSATTRSSGCAARSVRRARTGDRPMTLASLFDLGRRPELERSPRPAPDQGDADPRRRTRHHARHAARVGRRAAPRLAGHARRARADPRAHRVGAAAPRDPSRRPTQSDRRAPACRSSWMRRPARARRRGVRAAQRPSRRACAVRRHDGAGRTQRVGARRDVGAARREPLVDRARPVGHRRRARSCSRSPGRRSSCGASCVAAARSTISRG